LWRDALTTIFYNGSLMNECSWERVRANARK
jgi:hypothetical protein